MTHLAQHYFSASAKRHPNKTAIACNGNSITYADADNFSNAFAKKITASGAKRGSFVPIFMAKSVASTLSILSILKADCAYVPIDASSPAQRLSAILKATEAPLVIVDQESETVIKALLPESERPPLINISKFEADDITPTTYQNLSIDIAYVLFTSGSTGIPKGVMISHQAIIDYIESSVETFQLNENDVIANHAPMYFDLSTFDMYCAFKTGATLQLVHDELNIVLPRLVKWLGQNDITCLFCVPSVLTLLLKSRRLKPDAFPKLRHIICAGEVLPPATLRAWMKLYPHIQFANMYGPTEITVTCCYHILDTPPAENELSIPIGQPRSNMELLVRTADDRLTSQPGSEGELMVRGTSVAYGYLGDTAKTEKAFIQNPQHSHYHDPLYCTGDLVNIAENGDIIYMGRIDDQIKHMGYRIELGEIEASLASISEIEEGVIVYGENPATCEKEIGAFISLRAPLEITALKQQLKSKLPSYMVPTLIHIHKDPSVEFPRTPNGKYNRKAIKEMVYSLD